MYTAEVLGKLTMYREPPMAASSYLRNHQVVPVQPLSRTNIGAISGRATIICGCTSGAKGAGGDVFSVTSANKCDVDYMGESTKGDLNVKFEHLEAFGDSQATLEGPIEEVARMETEEAEILLTHLGILSPSSSRHSPRGIFCSRTLNLRSISAIGYDMDYTLMHYNVMAWEGRAYDYCMENLKSMGFPVDGLSFDPNLVIRGLVIDKERGNLVKADRFGYVKRAMHGTTMLSTQAVRCDLDFFNIVNVLMNVNQ